MRSQLNVVGGPTGIRIVGMRYESLPVILDALDVAPADRLDVIDGFSVIESEMVRQMNGG